MWFLARKEIVHNKTRFGLFVGLVGLVSFLVFVMTGLSTGLGEASVSGLRTLTARADLVVFAPAVEHSLSRSDVDVADQATIAATPGVTAVAPMGQSMINLVSSSGATTSVALVGVPADGGFVPTDRVPPTNGLILDNEAKADVAVGDVVNVQPGGQALTVSGFADLGSLQHTPVAYTPLATWQQLRYATFESNGTAVPDRASAFLVQTAPGQTNAASAAIAGESLDPTTPGEAISASPGYSAETGTINLIRTFLFGIAALLIGTVFWVLTLQKEGSLAVLRAAGAKHAMLLVSYIIQVAATTVTGVAAGLVAATLASLVMPATAYVLNRGDVVTASVLLIVLALAASATSMRRMLTIDPLLSLGRL